MTVFSDTAVSGDYLFIFEKNRIEFRFDNGAAEDLSLLGAFRTGLPFKINVFSREMLTVEKCWDFIESAEANASLNPDGAVYFVEKDHPDDLFFWHQVLDSPYCRHRQSRKQHINVAPLKISRDREIPLDLIVRRLRDYSGSLRNLPEVQEAVSRLAQELFPAHGHLDSDIVVADTKRKKGQGIASHFSYDVFPGDFCMVDQNGIMNYHGRSYELPKGYRRLKLQVRSMDGRLFVYHNGYLVATFAR